MFIYARGMDMPDSCVLMLLPSNREIIHITDQDRMEWVCVIGLKLWGLLN